MPDEKGISDREAAFDESIRSVDRSLAKFAEILNVAETMLPLAKRLPYAKRLSTAVTIEKGIKEMEPKLAHLLRLSVTAQGAHDRVAAQMERAGKVAKKLRERR